MEVTDEEDFCSLELPLEERRKAVKAVLAGLRPMAATEWGAEAVAHWEEQLDADGKPWSWRDVSKVFPQISQHDSLLFDGPRGGTTLPGKAVGDGPCDSWRQPR